MSELKAIPSDHPKALFLHDPEDREGRIDFVEYWRTLRKYLWAIVAFASALTLVAGVVAFVSTPIYEAQTTLLIETNKQKVVTIEDVYSGMGTSREYFQTQVEIIKSREVSLKTIAKLKLYDHPAFDPRVPKKGLSAFIKKIGFATEEPTVDWNTKNLSEAVLGTFERNLSIEPVRLSQLVFVRFQSSDPELAAQITNALAKVYIENDLEARYQMTRSASVWLQEQLSGLKEKLTSSEKTLQEYREKQGIVALNQGGQNGTGQQVEQLTNRLIEARTKLAEIEATYKTVKDAASSGDLASQPAVLVNVQVADAKRQAGEAARRLADVSQRYGKEHPKLLQAESDSKAANENLQRQVELVVGGITNEYERSRSTVKMLENALTTARGSVQNMNRKEFELGVYEREVESNRQMYDMFMKRAKETTVGGDLQSTVARIVDPAEVPGSPIKPAKLLIIVVAMFMGLMIGVMLALLKEALDNTLKTTEDVEGRLNQPLLTVLPMLSKKELNQDTNSRLVLELPDSLFAEGIRTARTGVMLSSVDLPTRTLLVTSSVPGEGKSTFSANLAMSHAMTQRTLLIDGDLRRPTIYKSFKLERTTLGLSELVAGTAKLSECIHSVEGSKLKVMPSGAIPPNPLELLHSERFAHTLDALAEHFDIIIIDSPPVELVSDAIVIATHTSGIIFVSKALSTPFPLARKSLQRLRRANAHIVGIVLNALDFDKAERHYGEYSGYGKYGYGGYGTSYGSYGGARTAKAQGSVAT